MTILKQTLTPFLLFESLRLRSLPAEEEQLILTVAATLWKIDSAPAGAEILLTILQSDRISVKARRVAVSHLAKIKLDAIKLVSVLKNVLRDPHWPTATDDGYLDHLVFYFDAAKLLWATNRDANTTQPMFMRVIQRGGWPINWSGNQDAEAVQLIGEIGPPAIPALLTEIERAIQSIGKRAAPEYQPEVVGASAAAALGAMGPNGKPAGAKLRAALKVGNTFFREHVISALGQIGELEALPELRAALTDKDRRIVTGAAIALGILGPDAKEAIPALEQRRQKAAGNMRVAIDFALVSVQPERSDRWKPLEAVIRGEENDREARFLAIGLLQRLRITSPALQALEAATRDPDRKISVAASHIRGLLK